MTRQLKHVAAVTLLCLVTGACGYRFSGTGSLPEGVERIFVQLFENQTVEVGLENTLSNAVTNQFLMSRKNALASQGEADATLKGTITGIRFDTLSRSADGASQESRVSVTVRAELVDAAGKTIWSVKSLSANEAFVGGGGGAMDGGRQEALDELSKRIAEQIYNGLTEDF